MSVFKKILLSIFLLANLIRIPTSASASTEFTTDFVTNYTVSLDGVTTVDQHISLKNNLSNIYATQYALEIGSTRLQHIKAQTAKGINLPTSVTQTDNTTSITLSFLDKVVGKNQSHDFTISYTNLDVTTLNGQVLEVNIPRISNADTINSFTVRLLVPQVYGDPSLVSPKNYQLIKENNYNILIFDKSAVEKQGITALFGEKQVFTFDLQYHLENPTVNEGVAQIALPPDTAYQQVFYDKIEPQPSSIITDPDGNWLATYYLKAKERITVVATGQAIVRTNPTPILPPSEVELSRYLVEQPYWQVNHPQIKELAHNLKDPKSIYQYLVDNYSYDYQKLDSAFDRLGAVKALEAPESVICQEFTDTFIALARAAGIPARELNGFAYTENSKLRPLSLVQDVLHSWPEYYDYSTKTWIPIDPTWGNTTGGIDYFTSFDLNHFVFAIHGLSSETPYPAGYYKLDDVMSKDINIGFSSSDPLPKISFVPTIQTNWLGLLGLPFPHKLTISNQGNHAYYHLPIQLTSPNFTITSVSPATIDTLLPFTSSTLSLKLKPSTGIISKSGILNVEVANSTTPLQIQVVIQPIVYVIIFIILVTIIATIAFTARRLLVYRRKRADSLRRQSQESQIQDPLLPPNNLP